MREVFLLLVALLLFLVVVAAVGVRPPVAAGRRGGRRGEGVVPVAVGVREGAVAGGRGRRGVGEVGGRVAVGRGRGHVVGVVPAGVVVVVVLVVLLPPGALTPGPALALGAAAARPAGRAGAAAGPRLLAAEAGERDAHRLLRGERAPVAGLQRVLEVVGVVRVRGVARLAPQHLQEMGLPALEAVVAVHPDVALLGGFLVGVVGVGVCGVMDDSGEMMV